MKCRRKPKGITARRRASKKAKGQRDAKAVYAAVDARDGRVCRYLGHFYGDLIHRHHIQKRRPGNTTVENVISLSPEIHLERVHGLHPTLRLAGNANVMGGVEVWERVGDGVWEQGPNI